MAANISNDRARARLAALGRLHCIKCRATNVTVQVQQGLGILLMCNERRCQAIHTRSTT